MVTNGNFLSGWFQYPPTIFPWLHKDRLKKHQSVIQNMHDSEELSPVVNCSSQILKDYDRQDMLEYFDTVTDTPRTLQKLAGLKVSRLIACHPGNHSISVVE